MMVCAKDTKLCLWKACVLSVADLGLSSQALFLQVWQRTRLLCPCCGFSVQVMVFLLFVDFLTWCSVLSAFLNGVLFFFSILLSG